MPALVGLRSPWGRALTQGLQGSRSTVGGSGEAAAIQTQMFSSPETRVGEAFLWAASTPPVQLWLSSSKAILWGPSGDFLFSCHSCDSLRHCLACRAECFGFFSLMYSFCPNKNTRENIYVEPTVFREAEEYAVHQSKPKGADILTSLVTVFLKKFFLASRGTERKKQAAQNATWT